MINKQSSNEADKSKFHALANNELANIVLVPPLPMKTWTYPTQLGIELCPIDTPSFYTWHDCENSLFYSVLLNLIFRHTMWGGR